MVILREASAGDLDFLVEVDLEDEGCSSTSMADWGPDELAEHRQKIAAFISEPDMAAWVGEDAATGLSVGMILWRFRNRHQEDFEPGSVFRQLDGHLFPTDGGFCEIFQLWVAPEYRRRGIATRLKRQAEAESLCRGVMLLYTHTEAHHTHVLELNRKLGYREVRRGPIWDEVVRVSLIKSLG